MTKGVYVVANQQTYYLAIWDNYNGNGMNYLLFPTYDAAFAQTAKWARNALEDWWSSMEEKEIIHYRSLSNEDLMECWGDITGQTEYFEVQPMQLQS
jgi:hypothetical protein